MQQTSNVNGERNTIVQIVGDGNTVVSGRPYLRLTRFEADRDRFNANAKNELSILQPTSRAIPLVGREAELKNLMRFASLEAPPNIRVRVLIGQGGSGKTRLALELCDGLSAGGWNAGFVTHQNLTRFFNQHDAADWGWQKPTLLVLDYVAAQAEVLTQWLKELQDRPSAQHPLRILLLERHASADSGWFERVFLSGGWGNLNTRALLDPPEPVHIRSLTQLPDRLAIVCSVLEHIAPGRLSQLEMGQSLATQIQQAPWGGDPLYLAMAAMTMARTHSLSSFQLRRTDLALEVAGHEVSRLQTIARGRGLHPELLQHLAACVTLVQGQSRVGAIELLKGELASPIGFGNMPAPIDVVNALHEALNEENGIAPVRPDLIGEALLIKTWKQHPEQSKAIERLFPKHKKEVLETLIRLVQDFGFEQPHTKQWFEELLKAHWNDQSTLQLIYESLPSETVALRDMNLDLTTRLLQLDSEASPAIRARRLNNLAIHLSELGQREEALKAAQEAVELRRQLAQQRPDAFKPYLAASLNNLANKLSELGQPEKALQAAQESVELYSQLAQQRPDAFNPDLAMSLNNLANMLSELGQREKALQAAQESVELYSQLAQQRPDAFNPDLAMSLNNLANMLSELGQREKALQAAQESVELYSQLAQQRPDAFNPYLAMSLNNLANRLSELGQREKALQAAQEAGELYSLLAQQRPDAFNPYLAMSLNNLANRLSELGQREKALQAAQESVELYSQLAQQRPDAFKPDLAGSLNNLALRLSALDRREKALQAAQEAVELYSQLAQQRPDAFNPDLAASLNNLTGRLSELGQREKALQAAQESVELYSQLAQQRPDAFKPDLAGSLNNLANGLSELGQREKALQAAQEAVELYSQLAQQRPDAFNPHLARSLIVLALRLEDVHGASVAVPTALEAINTLRSDFLRTPQAHRGLMDFIVNNYKRLCQAANTEPDITVLSPLLPHLNPSTPE